MHCLPHSPQSVKSNVLDQIPSLLKILYLDGTTSFGSASRKMGKNYGFNQPSSTTTKDTVFTLTNVYEDEPLLPATSETCADRSEVSATRAAPDVTDSKDTSATKCNYRKTINIAEEEPYCNTVLFTGVTSMFRHIIRFRDGLFDPN